jgi:hypothetical protein
MTCFKVYLEFHDMVHKFEHGSKISYSTKISLTRAKLFQVHIETDRQTKRSKRFSLLFCTRIYKFMD